MPNGGCWPNCCLYGIHLVWGTVQERPIRKQDGYRVRVSVYSLPDDGVRSPILNDSHICLHTTAPRPGPYERDQIWFMNIHIGWCYAAMCSTFGCQNHAPFFYHMTATGCWTQFLEYVPKAINASLHGNCRIRVVIRWLDILISGESYQADCRKFVRHCKRGVEVRSRHGQRRPGIAHYQALRSKDRGCPRLMRSDATVRRHWELQVYTSAPRGGR